MRVYKYKLTVNLKVSANPNDYIESQDPDPRCKDGLKFGGTKKDQYSDQYYNAFNFIRSDKICKKLPLPRSIFPRVLTVVLWQVPSINW